MEPSGFPSGGKLSFQEPHWHWMTSGSRQPEGSMRQPDGDPFSCKCIAHIHQLTDEEICPEKGSDMPKVTQD